MNLLNNWGVFGVLLLDDVIIIIFITVLAVFLIKYERARGKRVEKLETSVSNLEKSVVKYLSFLDKKLKR